MEHQNRKTGILYSIIAALLWSTAGIFVKILPQDAYTILFYRSMFTVLFFIIIFNKKLLKINRSSIVAALFYLPLMYCFVVSTKLTTAANAIFLQSTGVAYVLLLEPILLRTKLKRIDIFTVGCCFAGMLLFLYDGIDTDVKNFGIYIAMVSGIASAGMMLTQKGNDSSYIPSGIVMGNILVLLVTMGSFIENPYPAANEWLIFLFLGFVQLGMAFTFFYIGQKYIPAVESAMISLLEPVFNPIWVMMGYGEVPGIIPLIGGAIIIASLAVRLLFIKMKN